MTKNEAFEASKVYFNGDELAAQTFVDKYAMEINGEYEATPTEMHERMAKEYARIEEKFGGKHQLDYKTIFNLFDHFKYIVPGGSVCSGLGNENYIGSLSNCFVAGQPEDSYASIMKYRNMQVQLMKRRGGVGIDLSKLRPEGTHVNNAAKSSTGPVSFMNCFSELTKEVALNGRRGALMISISGNHPDLYNPDPKGIDFINCKQDLTKITGANISVKFSDAFMQAVVDNDDYILRWPVDMSNDDITNMVNSYDNIEYNTKYWASDNKACIMKVHAKYVWDKFVHCAWNTAEPGIMYEDKHLGSSPDGVYEQYKGVTTNPCVTGDTIVSVADGRGYVYIKQLAEENIPFSVHCAYHLNGVSLVKKKKYAVAFKTGTKDVLKIILSNGTYFRCTPDHKLATINGDYIEAKDSFGAKLIDFNDVYTQTNDIIPIHVIRIEYDGVEDVYDLSVSDCHNFYIHTTPLEDWEYNTYKIDSNIINDSKDNCILIHNCGEIFMEPGDSCRLMHINLASFVNKETKEFDYDLLEKVAYQNMQLCDDLVELELEHIQQIIEHIKLTYIDDNREELELWQKIYKVGESSRRAGCGATGVADAIALLGLKINSQESYDTIEKIFQVKMLGELKAQVDMAKERGTFVGYDFNKEITIDNNMIWCGNNEFFENLLHLPGLTPELAAEMQKYGRRNVSWSTMAPVGTGAIMTQGSSGVEPVFKVLYKRRKKCMNPDDRVDYVDEAGEKFTEFNVIHHTFKEWVKDNFDVELNENTPYAEAEQYFKQSPWYGCEAGDLTAEQHVELQALVQKYISHSIAKTCNLPQSATEQQISDIYLEGWKKNCKGITVYRDGCRSGVMITQGDTKQCKCETTLTHNAPKRPKTLSADIKRFKNGGDKWIAFVGLYHGQPYEIFTGLAEKVDMPEYVTACEIVKNKVEKEVYNDETGLNELKNVSSYDIIFNDKNGNKRAIFDVGNIFLTEFDGYGRLISGLLRTGMCPEYIVSTLKHCKFTNETINSWKAGVIRAIKTYIKDGDIQGEVCPACGGKIVRENGCKHCMNCGWSACQ